MHFLMEANIDFVMRAYGLRGGFISISLGRLYVFVYDDMHMVTTVF